MENLHLVSVSGDNEEERGGDGFGGSGIRGVTIRLGGKFLEQFRRFVAFVNTTVDASTVCTIIIMITLFLWDAKCQYTADIST